MVEALVVLLPPLVGGGLFLLDRLVPSTWGPEAPFPSIAHAVLVALAIAGAAFAASRRRRSGVLFSAWLLLLAGILLFSAGELAELVLGWGDNVVEEILRTAAFVPLAAFVFQVASPLAVVFASRRRRAALGVLALSLFAAVALVELLPVLAGATAALPPRSLPGILAILRPFLDILLFLPLAAVLAFAGLRRRGESYLTISLGILAMLPGDVLFHYDRLTGTPGLEGAAFALTAVSLLYFAIGSFRGAIQGEPPPGRAK